MLPDSFHLYSNLARDISEGLEIGLEEKEKHQGYRAFRLCQKKKHLPHLTVVILEHYEL